MGKMAPRMGNVLPRRPSKPLRPSARARVELARDHIHIAPPEGGGRTLELHEVTFEVGDAASAQRFVRQLRIESRGGAVTFVTPPEEGAIAPRALGLPAAPTGALVLDAPVWDTVVDWLRGGGRLHGRTVAELAWLARVATSSFAIAIGEFAARVAWEMTWENRGPMRGSVLDPRALLRPLEEAAYESARAAEALVAALAHTGRA